MKIYVASSWRNEKCSEVVKILRSIGHEVYDFKNPNGGRGFHWSDIDENWQQWTPEEYRNNLSHEIAEKGFENDFNAMKWADACVLVLPCGRSAHTEAGWFSGNGKDVYVLLEEKQEPELMYKLYDGWFVNIEELTEYFSSVNRILKSDKCIL